MRKTLAILFMIGSLGFAQIRGNKEIETRKFEVSNIETVKINFYSEVVIDANADEEYLEITTDSNLFDLIAKEYDNGTLQLDQVEWIKPSIRGLITIGAPNIKAVEQGTHEITIVKNLDHAQFRAFAKVGNIQLSGRVEDLRIMAEVGNVDAKQVNTQKASVNVWGWGKVEVNAPKELYADISNNGSLVFQKRPEQLEKKIRSGGQIIAASETGKLRDPDARYIKLKIENNSGSRQHFFVSGPKPDGGRFGYGFPLRAGQVRGETWTVGTKVYKVNRLGMRKLLVTIADQDENSTVELFK